MTSPPVHVRLKGHGVAATAFVVSLSLHVLAGVWLAGGRVSGGVAAEAVPEAISLNLVPSPVLDAADEQPALQQEAVASAQEKPEEPATTEGPANDTTAASPPTDAPPDTTAVQASNAIVATSRERSKRKATDRAKSRAEPWKLRHRNASTAAAGKGIAVRSGSVSAARGNIADYADTVRTRIARHKPGGIPNTGTATVAFAISPSGALLYARLTRSSGNSAIDAAAVQAVRSSSPFPPTPSGQRFSTAIPFHFR